MLTEQVVVRVSPKLLKALQADARRNGRTVTQTVRHVLEQRFTPERKANGNKCRHPITRRIGHRSPLVQINSVSEV